MRSILLLIVNKQFSRQLYQQIEFNCLARYTMTLIAINQYLLKSYAPQTMHQNKAKKQIMFFLVHSTHTRRTDASYVLSETKRAS